MVKETIILQFVGFYNAGVKTISCTYFPHI